MYFERNLAPRVSAVDRLKRFFTLPWKDQILLLRAAWLVGTIRLALYCVPFRSLVSRALKLRKGDPPRGTNAWYSVAKLAWAVMVASRWVPNATCLTQALAMQSLLSHSGYRSKLEIGVAKEQKAGLLAHAWVIWEDRIVIGGAQTVQFTVLGSWSNAGDEFHS